jgi:sugar phosphate isomerase/epimerase
MQVTRTGGFPIGFRQGWTEWFKDIEGMVAWTKSQDLSVIDLGGNCLEHLPTMKANGIRVGSVDLQDWPGLISEDPAHQAASLEANERFIAECAKFGVTNYFAVMLPKDVTKKRSENFALMMDSLAKLSTILEAHNGHLVIEGWPGAGALCCTPEGYRACLKDTSDAIGINYDPSHLIRMGIDPVRFLKEFANRVFHVHGKDCFVDLEAKYEYGTEQPSTFNKGHDFGNSVWRYTIPGHGVTPWTEVFTILKSAGYQGAVSIELEDENFNGSEAGEKLGIITGSALLASA